MSLFTSFKARAVSAIFGLFVVMAGLGCLVFSEAWSSDLARLGQSRQEIIAGFRLRSLMTNVVGPVILLGPITQIQRSLNQSSELDWAMVWSLILVAAVWIGLPVAIIVRAYCPQFGMAPQINPAEDPCIRSARGKAMALGYILMLALFSAELGLQSFSPKWALTAAPCLFAFGVWAPGVVLVHFAHPPATRTSV